MRAAERNGSVAGVVQEVAEHVRTLARLEGELATIELRRKAASFGAGTALLLGAMLLGVFTLGFALATIAAALATFLPVWLSLLLVSLGLAAAAIAAAAGGRALLRRSGPPVPEQAVRGSLHG
jgi:hypothetical protein